MIINKTKKQNLMAETKTRAIAVLYFFGDGMLLKMQIAVFTIESIG
jgi:hypothetical protein